MDLMLQRLVRFGKKRRAHLPLVLLCVFFLYAVSAIGDCAERLGKVLRGKQVRRLAAAALSLCLVFNLVPMTAFAAESDAPPVGTEQEKTLTYAEVVDLFAALPNADSITAEATEEEKAEITTQINAATDALQALSDEDFAKFTEEHSDLLAAVRALQTAIISDTPTLLVNSTAPTVDSGGIYANGAPLILTAGENDSTKTVIYIDQDGDGSVSEGDGIFKPGDSADGTTAGNDLSTYTIFGGGKDADLTGNTKITMTGGDVKNIYGGGSFGKKVTGNTEIVMNGGKASYVYGGGNNTNVTGSTSVTIGEAATVGGVRGGGSNSSGTVGTQGNQNTVNVVVKGTASDVYGGGHLGAVNGTISVTIAETANVSGSVYGGGSSTVNGDVSITVVGTVNKNVYDCKSGATVNGKIDIKITGAVGQKVDGSYSSSTGTGKSTLTIGGGAKVGQDNWSYGVKLDTLSDNRFAIEQTLGNDDYIYVNLPQEYDVSANPVIATGAIEGDVEKIKLIGNGAAGKEAYFDNGEIKVRASSVVVELLRNGTVQGKHDTLLGAIDAAQDGDTLKIIDNIHLGTTGVEISGKSLTLDLNGKTVTYSGVYSAIVLQDGADLTVTDGGSGGRLKATDSADSAIANDSTGTVTVSGGTVTASSSYGSIIAIANDSTGKVTVTGGTVSATGAYGIAIRNLSTGKVTVTGGTVEATDAAGIAIRNLSTGKITISGSAVVTSENTFATEGTIYFREVPTPAAVVLEIIGGTVKNTASPADNSVYFYPDSVTAANLSSYYTHTSGTVGRVHPAQPVVERYDSSNQKQGSYTSLSEAIGEAATGDTLKIIGNIDLGSGNGVTIDNKNLTLDLNGQTITYSGTYSIEEGTASNGSAITLLNGAALTIKDSSTEKNGKLEATGSQGTAICNDSSGAITIGSGTVSAIGIAIDNNAGGAVNVSGGTVFATGSQGFAIDNKNNGTITITGGKLQATGSNGVAISNQCTGKITISGNAVVTSEAGTDRGTISFTTKLTDRPAVMLDIQGGTVENTANPAGFAVHFGSSTGVTAETVKNYYTVANGATVGTVHPTPVAANVVPTVEKLEGTGYTTYLVYANGAALIINGTSNTSTTIYVDVDRDGVIDEGVDKSLNSLSIANAPGDNADLTGLTNCIIYGGGKSTSFTGNTKITMLGGHVNSIYGGGFNNGGDVIGSSEIILTGGHAATIYGGGNYANLSGSTKITVGTGGKAGSIYGVGEGGVIGTQGTTETVVTVLMEGEAGTIYGGGDKGEVYGNTAVTVTGTVNGNVYGGGNDTRPESTGVNGNTAVIITGTVRDNVYGGGQNNSTVTGTQTLTIGGGAKIGGAKIGDTDKGIIINSTDTTAVDPVKNGVASFKIDPNLSGTDGSIYVVLPNGCTGGTIATEAVAADLAKIILTGDGAADKEAYFGSASNEIKVRTATTTAVPTVAEKSIYANGAEIKIAAGTGETNGIKHTNILYDADKNGTIGDTEYLKIGDTDATAEGYNLSTYTIYGGGSTALTGDTKITMTGGNVHNIYGGNISNDVTGNTEIVMDGGDVNYIYGGNNSNNVNGNTKITMNGGEVKQFLYGGGLSGAVTGNTSVTIGQDATVSGIRGGGSNGAVGTQGNQNTVTVNVKGTVGSVYGGGYSGAVNGTISVSIAETAQVSGSVYGDGQAGSSVVNGNISVTVAGTVNSDVYGCGSGGTVNGDTGIKITGAVGGQVSGTSIGSTVTGKSTLTIGGGAKVGQDGSWNGVQLNTLSDSRFAIEQTLGNDAYIYVNLPWDYDASANPVIATGAIEGDLEKIKLVGIGAAGKEAYLDGTDIKVRASSAVVELLRNGTVQSKHDTLSAAITAAANSGDTLKILNDITLSSSVTISGKKLTLDLNGKTITHSGGAAITLANSEGAGLTVTDGSGTGTGKLEETGEMGTAIYNLSSGEVKVTAGTVSAKGGYAILNVSTGAVTVTGGTLAATTGISIYNSNAGKITISGTAKVTSGNTYTAGGTIHLYAVPNPAKTVLEITGGTVENTAANGYAVYFDSNTGVTSANVREYYTVTGSANVGKVYPEASNTPTVASVSVSPNPATVQKGMTQQFTAIVSGTNNPAQTVSWTVTGGKTGTDISNTGLLTVAADETAATLTVTAISAVDTTKSGSAAVTVQSGALTDAQKLAMAKSAIAAALDHLTVTNATTAQDILDAANVATLYGVAVAWDGTDGFSKTEATTGAAGSITGTLRLTLNGENGTVTVSKIIAILPDKTALTTAIAAANSAKNSVVVRDLSPSSVASGTRFVTTVEMETLNIAIAAAQTVMDNSAAAAAEITAAVSALNRAVTAFNGAIKTGTYTGGSSSGSGGSSGGGSGGGTVTPPTEAKPSAPTESEIKVDGKVDANGSVTVTLPEKTVDEAIKKAEDEARKNGNLDNGVTLVLNVRGGGSAGSVTVNLPKTTQETIISKKIVNTVIVVNNPDIKIGMDLSAVTSINTQAKADVNITATKQDNSKLTGNAKTAIGARPVFDLRVNYGGGKQVADFDGGSVSVAIPYTLGAGEKAGGVYAVYVDGSENVQWLTSSVYDAENKVLRFNTNHFSTYGVGYQAPADFTDIAGHWAEEDIQFVVNRGLLSGTGAAAFSPNTAMTRGMFVTALGRLAGADVSGYKQSSFTDVKADAYYMSYVEWAAKNGIVKGTTSATFAPDNAVTREQMAVMVANYAKAIGFELPKAHAQNTFVDAATISPWAADSVKAMQMAGVLAGKNVNRFDPQGTAARAEAAATLRHFMELMIDASAAQGWIRSDNGQWMYYENGSPVKNTTRNVGGENYSFNTYGVTLDFPKRKTGFGTYTVQAGDSFWLIAEKHNVSMHTLAEVNGKTIYSVIHPGDALKIPQ